MKPDLTRPVAFATYNGTDKVCTRSGLPWRGLGEIKSSLFVMAGAMLHPNGFETVSVWNARGRIGDREERGDDLFYALPEKIEKTFWILISHSEIGKRKIGSSRIYESKRDAEVDIVKSPFIQIVPITLLVEE